MFHEAIALARLLVRMFGAAERIGDDGVESTLNGGKLFDGNAKDIVLCVVEVLFTARRRWPA